MKHALRALAGLGILALMVALAPYGVRATAQGREPADPDVRLLRELRQAAGGNVRVSRHGKTGRVRFLGSGPGLSLVPPGVLPGDGNGPDGGAGPEAVAGAFLAKYGNLFGLGDPQQELRVVRSRTVNGRRSFLRYQQVHRGVPVFGGELIVQVRADGAVLSASGEVLPALDLDVQPKVNGPTARDTALAKVAKDYEMSVAELEVTEEPSLRIYNPALLGGPGRHLSTLVWQVEVGAKAFLPIRELLLVDAQLGHVTLHFNQIHTGKNRQTYDAENGSALPGTLRRSEGDEPTGDTDVDNAHDFAGDTYDFFYEEHGRDSLDDAGRTLTSTTHFCPSPAECPYGNAYWNGSQMVYGEGMAADDVVGHELTHGVTNFSSNLFYYYQSGAINESLSDVWGEFIDQTNGAGTDGAGVDWQIGEDSALGVIRDMSNPPAGGDPDRIGSVYYHCGETDGGGVHTNSGVNNKAAFLLVDGGTFNGYMVSGLGIPKVADLYYEVQTNLLTSGSNYADLYDTLLQAAVNLGFNAAERQAVQDALDAVEMNQPPCSRPAEAPLCPTGESPVYAFQDDMENITSGNWAAGIISGDNGWSYQTAYARSGEYHLYGANLDFVADFYVAMTSAATIPDDAYLRFHHDWHFEDYGSTDYDGGVVEYSLDDGSTWNDAGWLFSENGYNGTITNVSGNPLGGRSAFTSESYGYTASRLDLSSLAGDSVRFRFRIGTDQAVGDLGWSIDDVGIYVCSPPAPAAPTLDAISNGDGDGSYTVTWSGETDATSYELQEQLDGGSWNSVYSGPDTSHDLSEQADGQWCHRVRASNAAGESDWSNEECTTVDTTAPAAPDLLAPGDGSTTGDDTPTFEWTPVSGAGQYRLQVDDAGDFSGPHIDVTTASAGHVAGSALPDGGYWWRVQAADAYGNWSEWSAVWQVTITAGIACDIPGAPALLAPADGSTTTEAVPAFDWDDVPEATEYQIIVDDDGTFAAPEIEATVDLSHYTPGTALADDTYAWRVRGRNVSGECNVSGDWSSAWSLTIDAVLDPPAAPSLHAISNGDGDGDYAVSWSSVPTAGAYELREQLNGGTWHTVYVGALTARSLSGQALGQWCYRVRASNAAGDSPWSAVACTAVTVETHKSYLPLTVAPG